MASLTITVDDEVLRRAHLRALEQETTVDAVLREYLKAYSSEGSNREQVVDTILDLSRSANSGRGGRRWSRDGLHER